MLASRLFREIYDIALLNRTEEEGEGDRRKGGRKEQKAKKGRKTMRGGGRKDEDGESEAAAAAAEMEEKGLRETQRRRGGLGGHGNYIFMRWFRQMALCRQKKEEMKTGKEREGGRDWETDGRMGGDWRGGEAGRGIRRRRRALTSGIIIPDSTK